LGAAGAERVAVAVSLTIGATACLCGDARSEAGSAMRRDRPGQASEGPGHDSPSSRRGRAGRTASPRAPSLPAPPGPLAAGPLLLLAFVSETLALGLETSATLMLSLVHENSLYAFALVVALFLVAIAAGAASARLEALRALPGAKLLGICWSA